MSPAALPQPPTSAVPSHAVTCRIRIAIAIFTAIGLTTAAEMARLAASASALFNSVSLVLSGLAMSWSLAIALGLWKRLQIARIAALLTLWIMLASLLATLLAVVVGQTDAPFLLILIWPPAGRLWVVTLFASPVLLWTMLALAGPDVSRAFRMK